MWNDIYFNLDYIIITMAESTENNYPVTGTIYSIKKDEVTGKKDPTQKYNKYTFILEVKSAGDRNRGDKIQYTTDTQLIVFELFNPKFDFESFNVGDFIFVRFFIEGKEFTYSKGERAGQKGVINRNIPTFIKYADLDGGHTAHKGKVKTDAMSSTDELPKRETVFVAPDPGADDDNVDELPF